MALLEKMHVFFQRDQFQTCKENMEKLMPLTKILKCRVGL